MGLRDMWWGCKEWLAVLVFISVLISSTVWYLSFNPQYVATFLATTVIAIGFMMVMVCYLNIGILNIKSRKEK